MVRTGEARAPPADMAERSSACLLPADDALVRLEGVGKDYAKIESNAGRVRLVFDLLRGRGAARLFCALDDISFEVHAGQSLGVIGENGAGKSTLLKIVAGVIAPSRGTATIRGRVSALLELGSGFHPEYTGAENIELAAALLGLTPREIARKRQEIIDFADIGEHLYEPIKHYSSGMVVRLGFAVATALDPDVLITDEVLSVGDESFQKKCMAWIEGYLARGGTLLLCTHSMYHIQKLCHSAIWLKGGRAIAYGPSAKVTGEYLQYHEAKSALAKRAAGSADASAAAAAGYYVLKSCVMLPGESIAQGATLELEGEVYSPDGRPPVVMIGIVCGDGTPVYGVATDMEGVEPMRVAADRYSFHIEFPDLPLLPGEYFVRTHVLDPEGVRLFDTVEKRLVIAGSTHELGFARMPHEWDVEHRE